MKMLFISFLLCVGGLHQSFAQAKKTKKYQTLFNYHLSVLDSAAMKVKGDTVSCCSSSIAFMVVQTDVEIEAEGTTFSFLYFTKGELEKWHQWYNANYCKRKRKK